MDSSPHPTTTALWQELDGELGQLASKLRRHLLRRPVLPGDGLLRGSLSGRYLHRAAAQDGRIFRRKRRDPRTDAAFSMLIDLSGSMARQRRARLAMLLAMAFSQACEWAGVPCEVLGFTTWDSPRSKPASGQHYGTRRTPLEHRVILPFGSAVRSRCHAFARALELPMAENVDGEALVFASRRLMQRRERDRTLVVLSDGYPYDGVAAHANLLASHLRWAVQRVERSGIRVVGIGLKTRSVEDFYPNSLVVDDLSSFLRDSYQLISLLLR